MARVLWQHFAKQRWVVCAVGASWPMVPCGCDTVHGTQTKPAIYMTMGPSGAGKDTLLLGAREKLAREGDSSVEFVKRVITRDADKVTDLEIPVTVEDFKAASAHGDYAIEYFANHTHYAIPRASLEAGIASKKRLVLNVSRTVIDQVLVEYGKKRDVEVYCLNITASDAELKKRLLRRGRESAAEVEERIARAKLLDPKGPHVICVLNEASREAGIDLATKALTGKMKYSLWLAPSRDSPANMDAAREIKNVAATHGESSFPPHITVGKSFISTQGEAIQFAQAAADAIGSAVQVTPCDVSVSTSARFRAAVVNVEKTEEICNACVAVRCVTPTDAGKCPKCVADDVAETYTPHISFLYGLHNTNTLEAAKESVQLAVASSPYLDSGFSADELVLVMTSGEAYNCWNEVARFPLQSSR